MASGRVPIHCIIVISQPWVRGLFVVAFNCCTIFFLGSFSIFLHFYVDLLWALLKLLLIVFISNRNEVNYELCRTSIVGIAAVVIWVHNIC